MAVATRVTSMTQRRSSINATMNHITARKKKSTNVGTTPSKRPKTMTCPMMRKGFWLSLAILMMRKLGLKLTFWLRLLLK